MDKESVGTRLRLARKRLGWNQEQLQAATGIKQSAISKIERGAQKSTTDIAVLANALGVNALWLSTGQGPMLSYSSSGNFEARQKIEDDRMLYQYTDPRCKQGIYYSLSDKPELDALAVSYTTLQELGVDEADAVAYIHHDESMSPTLLPGDKCVVRTDERDPVTHNGRLFAIASGDHLVVRRIVTRATGGYIVSCDSQDKTRFPDEILSASDAQNLRIVGRLCWSSGRK
jgi:phage repressor protein C with HTH and peptisase S24 domain